MIRSAVTICLVPEARGGPFVFWDDLESGCRKAAELGFDAVEVFAPGASTLASPTLGRLLDDCGLRLAAVGTGAGWLLHRLSLTDPDGTVRSRAREFIRELVDVAGAFGAPAIVGSMQGRWGGAVRRESATAHLVEALEELGQSALPHGTPLLYEPLNRYETNIANTLADGAALVDSLPRANVKVLADLYHMNIDEAVLSVAIRTAGRHVGHVHFADSNRRPAGCGHTDFAAIAAALRDIGYDGYVSAECLPYPNPDEAARLTIESFRTFFR